MRLGPEELQFEAEKYYFSMHINITNKWSMQMIYEHVQRFQDNLLL